MDPHTAFLFRGSVATTVILGTGMLRKLPLHWLALFVFGVWGVCVGIMMIESGHGMSKVSAFAVLALGTFEGIVCLRGMQWLRGAREAGAETVSVHVPRLRVPRIPRLQSLSPTTIVYDLAVLAWVIVFPPKLSGPLPTVTAGVTLLLPVVVGEILCASAHGNEMAEKDRTRMFRNMVHTCVALTVGFLALNAIVTVQTGWWRGDNSSTGGLMLTGTRQVVQLAAFPFATHAGATVSWWVYQKGVVA